MPGLFGNVPMAALNPYQRTRTGGPAGQPTGPMPRPMAPQVPGPVQNFTGQQGEYYGSQARPGFNLTKQDPATLGPNSERGFVQGQVNPAYAPQQQLGTNLRMSGAFANSDHFRNAFIQDRLQGMQEPPRQRFTNPYQPPAFMQTAMNAAMARPHNPGSNITDQERTDALLRRDARTTPNRY